MSFHRNLNIRCHLVQICESEEHEFQNCFSAIALPLGRRSRDSRNLSNVGSKLSVYLRGHTIHCDHFVTSLTTPPPPPVGKHSPS